MRIVKYTLLLCASLSFMCTAVVSPAMPMMKKTFTHYNDAELWIKMAATIPNILIAIFSPIFGLLLAKLKNRKIFLVTSCIFYVLSGCIAYFLNDLYLIAFSRAVLGISIAAVMTCGLEMISRYFVGHERNKVLAAQTTVMSLGSITFTMLSGYLCDINWRYAFLLYGMGIVLGLMIILFIPKAPVLPSDDKKTVNTEDSAGMARIFGQALPFLICVIGMINMVFFYMIPIQVPFLLKQIDHNVSGKMISFVITAEVIVSAFFATKYKRLKKNHTFEALCCMSFGIMSVSYLVLSYANSYNIILLCVACYGIGMAFIMPNNIIWIVNIVRPNQRGFWIGMLTTGIYLGKFISPIVLKPIIDNVGLLKSYRIMAVAMLLIAILFSFLTDGMRKENITRHYRKYRRLKTGKN